MNPIRYGCIIDFIMTVLNLEQTIPETVAIPSIAELKGVLSMKETHFMELHERKESGIDGVSWIQDSNSLTGSSSDFMSWVRAC